MSRIAVVHGLTFAPLLLAACGAPPAPVPPVPHVLVQTVAYKPGGASAIYPGEVRARHEADLGFRIGGKILARSVDVGATVKQGQVLALLDPQDVRLASQAAQAQSTAAQTDLRFAEAELRRSETLLAKRFISQTAFDAKKAAHDAARARVDQAQAQRAVADNQAAYAQLLADRDGVITAALAEAGQVVAAGQPVLRLAQPQEREVWLTVPENRLAELRAAPSIKVGLWSAPQRLYAARIREIAASADAVTRSFQVKLSLPDADEALRLGMSANVLLGGADAKPELRLPAPALGSREGKPVVWVASAQNEVQPRPVEVLRYVQGGVILGDGLKDGEQVVIAGVHKLVPGQKVSPQPAPRAVDPPR